METLEEQCFRSCDLHGLIRDAMVDEAMRCGWVDPEPEEAYRDWLYAYLAF